MATLAVGVEADVPAGVAVTMAVLAGLADALVDALVDAAAIAPDEQAELHCDPGHRHLCSYDCSHVRFRKQASAFVIAVGNVVVEVLKPREV